MIRWDHPALAVPSDTPHRARYRLLQSWWRHHELGVQPGFTPSDDLCGSMLRPDDVGRSADLAFLDRAAAEHAADRIRAVKAAAGQLNEFRLRHNLLTSMGVAFNLFGSLRTHPDVDAIVAALTGHAVATVDEITCEWAPLPKVDHLADNTAFDAVIRYRRPDGTRCLVGVEVKYTEPLSQKAYDSPRYQHVTAAWGWFLRNAGTALVPKATNQLWRQVMLAATCEQLDDVDHASAVVFATAADPTAAIAVDAVRVQLVDAERLRFVCLEDVVDAAAARPELTAWADRFTRRYLDLTPVRHADPL